MRILIRYLTRSAHDAIEYRDVRLVRDVVRIGRASGQTVQLIHHNVALHHALIRRGDDGTLHLDALGLHGIAVNDELRRSAALAVGDKISIVDSELVILPPEPDTDVAISVQSGVFKARDVEVMRASLHETRMSRRRWSWLAFCGVLMLGLWVPWFNHVSINQHFGLAGQPQGVSALGARMGNPDRADTPVPAPLRFLPSDAAWLAGPLHKSHAALMGGCQSCHQERFQPVQDQVCLVCHSRIGQHAPLAKMESVYADVLKCTSCHREHQEPQQLIRREETLCSNCHLRPMPEIESVGQRLHAGDFSDTHPELRLRLLLPQGHGRDTKWKTMMKPGPAKSLEEHSNLKYSHEVHLRPEGVKDGDGKPQVLQCANCHRMEEDGKRMQVIQMERDCRSCHRLRFDTAAPEREVPHGDPEQVQTALEEYFARQFLLNASHPPLHTPAREAQRPGHEITLSPEQRALAISNARQQAASVAGDLFERQVCTTCHTILKQVDPQRGVYFDVEPVRLNTHWMPAAEFSHRAHQEWPCGQCHAATTSKLASDVLLPDLTTCRQCHGGESARGRIPSACITCHQFHRSDMPAWRSERKE